MEIKISFLNEVYHFLFEHVEKPFPDDGLSTSTKNYPPLFFCTRARGIPRGMYFVGGGFLRVVRMWVNGKWKGVKRKQWPDIFCTLLHNTIGCWARCQHCSFLIKYLKLIFSHVHRVWDRYNPTNRLVSWCCYLDLKSLETSFSQFNIHIY